MKAATYTRYGPPEVIHLSEISKPTPKDDEVLIRVMATTVTVGDTRMRSFTVPRGQWLFARLFLGVLGPRRTILGMEMAGVIEAVGSRVTRFRVGDAVMASTFEIGFGAHVEYKCMPEDGVLTIKPERLTYAEAAAAVGAGMTALRCLHKAGIQPGQDVLIYGASGAVGTSAVQIAHHLGATVTGVCSGANLDLVRSLGADRVIDYTRTDFSAEGPLYDVIFDAVAKFPPAQARRALKSGGVYLNVHRDSDTPMASTRLEELQAVTRLLETGALKPVIDRCYALDQIVEAHRYVDQGHKKGSVVIIP